ncbi:MAG: hypothetical protein OEV81_13570 [Betaproteobacteria bacterium]|nr:hypothetical protein [Betaproteobacteria bacterium]MDH5221523.1 hypothetical protein [Betaproteobacteria bacterium]MDH5349466.1 hypothetical protein [Betaproteobacteria bacterium]
MTPVFDYRALRLLMGIIAVALPIVVSAISTTALSSISASYHTESRDFFVGLLFVVAALLWAYNGHAPAESRWSKTASVAAIAVALLPTACDTCPTTAVSVTHYVAAGVLFSILAYFCFVYFRMKTKGMPGKKGRRSKIYFVCGLIMVACMLAALVANFALPPETLKALRVTYWAEAIALGAFGLGWIVAGKYIPWLIDREEALHLFRA